MKAVLNKVFFDMEKDMKTSIIFFMLLSLTLFSSPALAAGPWKGTIIDIETKEPICGAVVLAIWQRAYRTPAGDNTYFYEAKEVLTDKEGRFEIPSYSPINLLPLISYIREPEFTIFKPGYLSLSDRHLEENVIDSPAEFKNNGMAYRLAPGVIELPKLKTWIERIESHESADRGDIPTSKIPKFKQVLKEEDNYLKPMYRFDRKKLNIPVGEFPK